MKKKEDCIYCGKECLTKFLSDDNGGYIVFCSLNCGKEYIESHWRDFIWKDE